MGEDSRTSNSIRNITMGFAGQAFQMILGFVSRMIFVRCLSQEYLGINGLFTNILSMLSLAELGIGTAIVYALYKPLAIKDEEKIASLMKYYGAAYKCIGIFIAAIGACLIPFLGFFIGDAPKIKESITLIYCIYLFNTASSYFFSYKCSILNADQKNYIVVMVNYGVVFIQTIVQIVLLVVTRNFILYLLWQALGTFVYNIMISRAADKRYPYIRKKEVQKLDADTKKDLLVNIKSLVIVKVSGVLVNSTDNIIISALKGLAVTGVNSNYTLLTQTLNSVISQIFNGIGASVGNLNALESPERKKEIFDVINLMNFWLYGWSSIAFLILANDIVRICFGETYVLPLYLCAIIAANFYTVGMQNAVWTYKSTMGLFKYGRYMVLVTGVINIILSILLGQIWGLFGILFATLISRALTNIWYDPYAVFKYGLKMPSRPYFIKYIWYLGLACAAYAGLAGVCSLIHFGLAGSFAIKLVICIIVPNAVFLAVFRKKKEFLYLKNKLAGILKARLGKN